jgi:hypothetical protein
VVSTTGDGDPNTQQAITTLVNNELCGRHTPTPHRHRPHDTEPRPAQR